MAPPVGALLWRSLRTYQIYGANTDVGKTVFASVLCNAARNLWPHEKTAFLKPVSTGPATEADDSHIQRFAPGITKETLFQFEIPASPHLAAAASDQHTPTDNEVLRAICDYSSRRAAKGPGWLFIETAGGVHSPAPSGTPQADLYAPLRVPVVFVGDAKLGGISQTISAFESLRLRGYDVESILLFRDDYYQNHAYLTDYFARDRGIPVATLDQPPARAEDADADADAMTRYYQEAASTNVIKATLDHLDDRHLARISRLETMAHDAHDTIWYPFTQHKGLTPDKITAIDSAHGDNFQTLVPESRAASADHALLQPSFDGSSSWWTQGLGHANPKLTLAASYAAGRYGHVMFASAVHEPALALAQTLLKALRNPRLARVFYSDNGSTGMEVAVKMGLRAARVRYGWAAGDRLEILGLRGSYHGDTMGAMDSTEPSVFNKKVEWYSGKGFWFDYPSVMCKDGRWQVRVPEALRKEIGEGREFAALSDVFDVSLREATQEARSYEKYIIKVLGRLRDQGRRFGALVMEPVILGAGGMIMADPLFQRTLVKVVRQHPELFGTATQAPSTKQDAHSWTGLPVVFDEVFTGLTRLGRVSAASFLGVDPDVVVNAKLLTGGLVPLCTTCASDSIFRAFESDEKSDALLHGHSYTAHPVGCQVAVESLRELQRMDEGEAWDWAKAGGGWASHATPFAGNDGGGGPPAWSVWSRHLVDWVSRRTGRVDGVWALGSVLAIHMQDSEGAGYSSTAAANLQSALLRGEGGAGEGARWNVHSRVLGNVLYVMTSQTTGREDVGRLEALLRNALAG
ncbi:Bifunctional dethiobiotin synthetase/7,8-diamino-pelargonic acid aminotransferase, mitochondrial [Colletotrichum tanaceti]|uniref:Bifunctional dethiobiotin synthetase/7,8-diamino-pelargonic acid aminotransferase, mitochondrial n=1 Tax=Colletotrichum tanaceti TaxID=1306861 RepID=A0A4U6X3T3_9PEZI|nr:Bifunctional dethiobiotin synthetase/7,8-diamino-pelargonic acid aminotransferase, mitochondrial [Colletotrichum tanaceti]TKW50028.1 Bifunctional dethiobiotin synthetase/7,8-diamino-pelargonic acid aminotransferase, mitochondrial [Colletotrichum tanaceti]